MVSRNEISVALRRIRASVLRHARSSQPPRARRTARLQAEQHERTPPVLVDLPPATSNQARNIRLGLERIIPVAPLRQTWKGVHVAGTNGKGSICAFLNGLFKLSGYSFGTYTSPAFPERHNAITINGMYVNKRTFEGELQQVENRSRALRQRQYVFSNARDYADVGDLTPFEADTATAFGIFNKMRVQYGIVEVGMGGATDATNVMKQKSVTIISKIDLDHQEYLGNTLSKIARVKAGIMQPQVPCVVDYTNDPEVMKEIYRRAKQLGCPVHLSDTAQPLLDEIDTTRFHLEQYQKHNLLCALRAFQCVFPNMKIDVNRLLELDPFMPGRLELVGVEELTLGQRQEPVLVDGAHNMLGVETLATHVNGRLRNGEAPVTWVMSISAGPSKPFAEIIKTLVKPQDNVAFINFQQGPTDPPPAPVLSGREIASTIVSTGAVYNGAPNIMDAIQWASQVAAGGPLVVTGSLYLIRDFFKLEGLKRTRDIKSRSPGRSQLYQYATLENDRSLKPDDLSEFKRARRYWYLSPTGINRHRFRAVTGSTQWPPQLPEAAAKLQSEADYHEQQAATYKRALEGIRKDTKRGLVFNDAQAANSGSLLQNYAKELQRQVSMHQSKLEKAMAELRKYSIVRYKRSLAPEEILGRKRPLPRGFRSPFMDYKLPAPSTTRATDPEHDRPNAQKHVRPIKRRLLRPALISALEEIDSKMPSEEPEAQEDRPAEASSGVEEPSTTGHNVEVSNGAEELSVIRQDTEVSSRADELSMISYNTEASSEAAELPIISQDIEVSNEAEELPTINYNTEACTGAEQLPTAGHDTETSDGSNDSPIISHDTEASSEAEEPPTTDRNTEASNGAGEPPMISHGTDLSKETEKPSTTGYSIEESTMGPSDEADTPLTTGHNTETFTVAEEPPMAGYDTEASNGSINSPITSYSMEVSSEAEDPPITGHNVEISNGAEEPPTISHDTEASNGVDEPPITSHSTEPSNEAEEPPTTDYSTEASITGHSTEASNEADKPPATGHSVKASNEAEQPSTTGHDTEASNGADEPSMTGHSTEAEDDGSSEKSTPSDRS